MMREIETRLSDSRVGNNSVVDHRSPSALHCIIVSTDVMSDHVGIKMQPWRWMLKDVSIHRLIWIGFDDLKHIVSCRFTT